MHRLLIRLNFRSMEPLRNGHLATLSPLSTELLGYFL